MSFKPCSIPNRSLKFPYLVHCITIVIDSINSLFVCIFTVEERHLMTQSPDMSPEDVVKELQVSLLADLQEKQTSENNAIQNLIKQQVNFLITPDVYRQN